MLIVARVENDQNYKEHMWVVMNPTQNTGDISVQYRHRDEAEFAALEDPTAKWRSMAKTVTVC